MFVFLKFPLVFYPDATYQVLEPAHRLAFGYGVVTWEWREGVRSWVLPAMEAILMRLTAWMGPGSSGYLYATGVVLSLLSLTSVWFGYAWAKRIAGECAGIIAASAIGIHFWMLVMASQSFSEVVATSFLLPGLYFGYFSEFPKQKWKLFFAGLLLGAAIGLRIQLLPAACIACLWFCYVRRRQGASTIVAGFLLSFLVFGLADLFTQKLPFYSYFEYFRVNILEHKASGYGTSPWYYYLKGLLLLLGPAVLLLWQGARRSPFLAAIVLSVFLSSSFIGHKELRFIYPTLPIFLTLAAIGAADYATMLSKRIKRSTPARLEIWVGTGFLALLFAFAAFAGQRHYGKQIKSTEWIRPAYIFLSQDSNVCGLGLLQIPWYESGGEVYLHRNVPVVPLDSPQDLDRRSAYFNNFFTTANDRDFAGSFHRLRCWQGHCLYQRPGGCSVPPEKDTINGYLRENGE
jgi:hypothetical protein